MVQEQGKTGYNEVVCQLHAHYQRGELTFREDFEHEAKMALSVELFA